MPRRKGNGEAIQWLRSNVGHQGDECLIWPFYRDKYRGYGVLGFEGRLVKAHRMMCELVNGQPPTPRHIPAHSCGKGHLGCVHPKHLSWKTRSANQLDRRLHGTDVSNPWGPRGHQLTETQLNEILALKGQRSTYEIGEMFGVSFQTIGRIHRTGSNKTIRRAA